MLKGTLESRISYRIKRNAYSVFLRKDFEDIGGYDQVGRVLKKLVGQEKLISLGYGIYARTKVSRVSGAVIPEKSLPELAKEAMTKLNVKISVSQAERNYNKGLSTQVPTGRVVAVKSRVSRKVGYNGKYVKFEKVA